jgi:predicted acetyltransferase
VGRGAHQAGTGLWLAGDLDVDTRAGFAVWLGRLRGQSDTSLPPEAGMVHATYWWIVQATYLGAITLRHDLNELLREVGGHIGFGVRPSARRRGLARWALAAVLPRARSLGLGRVLVTCDDDNLASARTIEANGGVLEDVHRLDDGPSAATGSTSPPLRSSPRV